MTLRICKGVSGLIDFLKINISYYFIRIQGLKFRGGGNFWSSEGDRGVQWSRGGGLLNLSTSLFYRGWAKFVDVLNGRPLMLSNLMTVVEFCNLADEY